MRTAGKIVLIANLCCAALHSQNSFDSLSVNNIHAGFNASGDLFWDDFSLTNVLTIPGNGIQYSAAALWIGGYDQAGRLHVSAQTYRAAGSDFWPGPLDTCSVYCPQSVSNTYNYVWNLKCSEVDSFIACMQLPPPGCTVPPDIQTWPGNGSSANCGPHYIAPFTDFDGDQYYNYAAVDYPSIMGAQSLFYVYNDTLQNTNHTSSNGGHLGLQIKAMPYAYDYWWDDALMNTIFIHYTITNYSTNTYTATSIGLWLDQEFLGGGNHVASDSLTGVAYHYNADNAMAIYFPDDTMSGVIVYDNNASVTGNPQTPLDYYELLNHAWSPWETLTYGGTGYNTGDTTRWMFTGNPVTGTGWNETSLYDKRTLITLGPMTLLPGATREFTVAMSFAYDTTSPYASFTTATQYAQHVRQFYPGNNTYCSPQLSSVESQADQNISVYPNPANTTITIANTMPGDAYSIYDAAGHLVTTGVCTGTQQVIDISNWADGVYMLQLTTDKQSSTTRIVKTP